MLNNHGHVVGVEIVMVAIVAPSVTLTAICAGTAPVLLLANVSTPGRVPVEGVIVKLFELGMEVLMAAANVPVPESVALALELHSTLNAFGEADKG